MLEPHSGITFRILNDYFTEISDITSIFISLPDGICKKFAVCHSVDIMSLFCRHVSLTFIGVITRREDCRAAAKGIHVPVGITDSTSVHNNYSMFSEL